MLPLQSLESKFSDIQKRIRISASLSGRTEKDIQFIAVTKGLALAAWEYSLQLSLQCIGESRIQEIIKKSTYGHLRDKIELHLIGRLQSNKTRKAVYLTDVIQTVDSIKLAKQIDTIACETEKKQRIYLQVNIGKDPKKTGFNPSDVLPSAEIISALYNVKIEGIMTIPPRGLSRPNLQQLYAETRKIRDKVKQKITPECSFLSMGMSNDYETAIIEGSTHVRIGTALFGPRAQ